VAKGTKGDLNPPQPSFKKGGRPVGTKGIKKRENSGDRGI